MTMHRLSGRITRNDNHQGVIGVRVEAWDADTKRDDPLAVTLTLADGSYRLEWRADDGDCCDCPNVYVRLLDRDCRVIYDGCSDRRCCEQGKPLTIDVALPPQTLWWHLSRPLAWERIDEPLIPVRVMQEIEDAQEVLGHDTLRLAHCAAPALEGFERVLLDAWGALRGDLDAARRLRDVLDLLCGSDDACRCRDEAGFGRIVDPIFDGACDTAPPTACVPPDPCGDCAEGCDDGGCDCGAPFLSPNKVTLLLVAALHVACGDQRLAKRWVSALLEQFCRFGTLAALHAASLQALLGDAAAKAHARDLLEALCERCGSPDHKACQPRHPPGCCEPCLAPGLAQCLRQAAEAWCRIRCWHICEVRPPRACAGDEILIVGCGFGDRPGQVLFDHAASATGEPLRGEVKAWCDDRISVVVPQGAGCGLSLRLPPQVIALCGRFLELHRIGCIDHGFEGTSAQILRFDIKGHGPGECPLQPGEPLRIRWNTCAADRVRVELIDLANNQVIAAQDPAAPSGRWDFTATNFDRTVRMRVRITAFGRCQPPQVSRQIDLVFQRRPNLSVQGLEVTQAIQHYRASEHLTDPADRGPDNSLRLVVNKTAWVRVYLRSGQDPAFDNGQLAGVTGTLRVERRVAGVWGVVANLAPQNAAPVTAEDSFASYDAERGNINTTLNFVVPAATMTGLLRFTADVRGPFAPCPGHVASGSTKVDVNLQQTLNAAFITIGYDGPNADRSGNITLPAPTLATCQTETSWAMTTYPVSGAANTRIAGTFVTNTPIDDPRSCDGCCSPNWGPLLDTIEGMVDADQLAHPGENWVYYGIIASGIPVNVPGCSGNATGGVEGAPITYAHEIGHQFGLPHARCGNAGGGNPSYPVYEPYDEPVDPPGTTTWTMASIGEYGLDINSGAIANPNSFEDFMSYCVPRWISVFTHNHFVNLAELEPVVVPTGAGAPRVIEDLSPPLDRDDSRLAPRIVLYGSLGADGSLEVTRVARIVTSYRRRSGVQTDYVVQHLDAQDRVLAQDVLYAYASDGGCGCGGGERGNQGSDCGCGGCGKGKDANRPRNVRAALPDVAPGATLRVLRRDQVVWEQKASEQPPKISHLRAELDPKQGRVEMSWKLEGASDHAEAWVRWSADEGKTWHALTVGVKGTSVVLPLDPLPDGAVRLQLLVHDGLHTLSAESEPLALPSRAPSVAIFYPADGSRVYGDRQMHLWGSASSPTYPDGIAPDSAEWFIDGKSVGRGFDQWVESPGPGRHRVEVVVGEGELAGRATSNFEVSGGSDDPQEPS